jgi:hypothetical protein
MVAQVGYLMAGRSRCWVALCAVCTMHMETRSAGFLVESQNQGQWFVSGLASKLIEHVFWFMPQNQQPWFGDLILKITTTVSWFVPQNQAGISLSVAPQNRRRDDGVGHVSRSGGLLRLKVSRARVFQSCLKTGRGTTAGGARGTITDVALGSS